MEKEHFYHFDLGDGQPCPDCGYIRGVTVNCTDNCGAVLEPRTDEELRAAYTHWRYHDYLSGCSHGR